MKKILALTSVFVLLSGVVLSFVLYSNSPYNRAKNSNVYEEGEKNSASSEPRENTISYDEDGNSSAAPEAREKTIPYDEDENNSADFKESDNSDGVPSRVEVSGDAVQPENDISSNSGDDDESVNEDNDTVDSENNEEHELYSNIKLRVDTKSIRVSSGTETVYFYAETFIETDKILLVDANTVLPVATMVDDGRRSISGDDLMNDKVFSCKVELDISQAKYFEYYAVIRNDENKYDSIGSNTVKIKVYAGFTEKDMFDHDQVFTAITNLVGSDEFKSMDLDGKADATYRLLVELSENGTTEAPYSLIRIGSIHFDKDQYQYTFIINRGDLIIIPLKELHGNE